ncbi:polyprenol monophosphomannose synthase [Nitriliruptor alkaliphilus]|uniref:polyprenol monophosphomannose synthase n=1 Tax=Nitriliruptor alkaliphilus TaxID=427918 RepID=UPI0006966A23|nr:polyprenol monophosphomannose synthase [Nitriliruptor alkaliphilus]
MSPPGDRTLVVLPTYDERDTLPTVLAGLTALATDLDVLVVDDASPDGTGQLAEAVTSGDPHRHVLHRAGKAGLGSAYRTGFRWGLERGYDRFVAMDADLSHDPASLPELLAASARADLVIGSRYVPGGRVERWPLRRRLLSAGGNLYARGLTGLPVHDGTSGYRVVHRAVLEAIDVAELRSDGYAFQLEVAFRAWRAGFHLAEVPIVFVERRAGASKLSRAVVAEALWRTAAWAAREGRGQSGIHPASVRAGAAGPRAPGG